MDPTLMEPTLMDPTLMEPTLMEPTLMEPTLMEHTLMEPILMELHWQAGPLDKLYLNYKIPSFTSYYKRAIIWMNFSLDFLALFES